jgi:hypothetical protein
VTRPAAAAVAALVVAVVAAEGCGGGQMSPDLFALQRSGSVPGASLQMVVNDGGTVTCNGAAARPISDPLLLQARAVARDLHDPATRGLALAPGPQPVLRYAARTQDGHVSFSDDSPAQPAVLYRLALLVRQIAQQDCGLAR